MPYPSTTACCPSAVPPPCEPIAGTINGTAPSDLRCATAARMISAMLAIPRLPTVTATLSPACTLLASFNAVS